MPSSDATDFTLPPLGGRALLRRVAVPVALAIAAVTIVFVARSRVPAVADALRRASGVDPAWLAVGAGCEILSLAGYVSLLAFVAGRATPRVRARESAQITLAGAAATRLLPTAGAGGAALALWALRRAGLSAHAAARTLLAFLVVLYAVFLGAIAVSGAVLALGLVTSHGPEAVSAVPAVGALLAIAAGLITARVRRDPGGEAQDRVARLASGARLLGLAVRDACRLAGSGDRRLAGAVAYWGFDGAVLWAMLHAFGRPPVIPALALAYFVGQVANTLPLPGSVSGGIAGVLIAFGVPAELALPSVLTYRTIAVWLPTPVALAAVPGLRATVARWRREDAAARTVPDRSAPAQCSRLGAQAPRERDPCPVGVAA